MIGIFLRNKDNDICFVQEPETAGIASFHYTPSAKMMTVVFGDTTEETITSEIAPEISEVFVPDSRILVVQLDETAKPAREYWATLTIG